ncbi:MAG: hypothetical protein ACRENE_03995 [Polyangiaceae bacterium]
MKDPRARRVAAGLVLASVVGFVALEASAMRLYPGGTWWDASTVGYRFWQNYLCDLEWHVALDGHDNTAASHLAKAAMLVLLVGLSAFWVVVPSLFGREKNRLSVRVLGSVSVAGTVAVALMPSDRFPVLHGFFVITAGVPGLVAAALAARALLAAGSLWPGGGRLGVALFAVALVNLCVYAVHWASGDEATPLLPAVQKVALFLLLAWMNGVALRVMRLARGAS